ncbi:MULTISPECIES: hypothetical protein [unclassified Lysinibacillus]|uniref:hypothetical protein n=1 Tax=unclassified Lysinibacillus TaxID=2636778 RepID=UPI00382EFBF7
MEYLFMDEKGPQETFEISNPFNKDEKLKNANDRMHSYVANIIKISDEAYKRIEEKYLVLEKAFRKNRPQLKEVKGEKILDKKNFQYGVASLHDNNFTFDFLMNFFTILIENIEEIDNLLFEVGKMSIVVDSRLTEWILETSKHFNAGAFTLKYSLTKYMENEAPEVVIKNMLDKTIPLNDVLESIKNDMSNIVKNNLNNQRMAVQVQAYKQIISLITSTLTTNKELLKESTINSKFNWNKVSWPLDLMLLELDLPSSSKNNERILYLDEGIPSEPFEFLELGGIKEETLSHESIGIRITDILVAIAGKYISGMYLDSKHDMKNLQERQLLSEKWFKLSSKHFDLIRMMRRFYIPDGKTYCINIDTYFDDLLLFVTFLQYVADYRSYGKYKLLNPEQHVENFFQYFARSSQEKFMHALLTEEQTKAMCGSIQEAIEQGLRKPL